MPSFPTYHISQCRMIFERLRLPFNEDEIASRSIHRDPERALSWLTTLQQAFLLNIPFENLELCYSTHKVISVSPDALISKIIVAGSGRGGYCMENNMLFATLLRSLGFDVMMTGGRVSDAEQPSSSGSEREGLSFTGFGHQVTTVDIDGKRYLVDVGFGNGGPTCPMLLEDGAECQRLPPDQKARMIYTSLPGGENTSSKVWLYERTIPGKEDQGWLPAYCFPDNIEFTTADFGVMNHFTSTARTSFFTYSVICSKFVADEETGGIVGHVTLFNDKVKREVRGEKETVAEFKTEKERVEGLERCFGVKLGKGQRAGIRGMVQALPS